MHTLNIFTSILLILLFLGIFVPYMNDAVNGDATGNSDADGLQDDVEGGTLTLLNNPILTNMLLLPFWTFGLNAWINLVILLPLRIILLISLWYIISPAK